MPAATEAVPALPATDAVDIAEAAARRRPAFDSADQAFAARGLAAHLEQLARFHQSRPSSNFERVDDPQRGRRHRGLDLAEAVEHALHAEVRRAARPDRSQARRGERNAGTSGRRGDVRDERCHGWLD